jgi:hypothetical protein
MDKQVGAARIGQWYQHNDKGEMFVVTGIDDRSGAIEIQSFDGDLDEIEASAWNTLPLELAEAPEDETGPLDMDPEDLGYSETEMRAQDWSEPLQAFPSRAEAWQDTAEGESGSLAQGQLSEEALIEQSAAAARAW